MAALTRYADDRARYDTTYIRDVYESVEAASSQFKLPANTTWPGVATALRDVRACLSIDANVSLRLGAAFVIFLVLQISRTWLVDGLCRLNWRRLTDAVFAYEASCDLDGNPVVDGDFRAHVRADLKRRLRAWLCVGRLKVIGAVLVHAAWVAPLARLRRDLAYAPH